MNLFWGVIVWIVIGALAGWIASKITGNDREMGAGKNILVGIVGAFVGGLLMNLFGGTGVTGLNLWSFGVALLGSIILLAIINMFRRPKAKKADL